MNLVWDSSNTAEELHPMLETLGEEYPVIKDGVDGIRLDFIPGAAGILEIHREGGLARISYGTVSQAARCVGGLLSGIPGEGCLARESTRLTTLGIMLDCSRNAVMKVGHIKKWLRRLALFGYNMVMLYTEDTYKLPGEDYFGYLRGAYSEGELREIDRYASKLGIEMIACIQTLGHMEQVIKWPVYNSVIKDTERVLLVGKEETRLLIEKMLDFWGGVFSSRRIHVGMDEAWDLGRGRYLDTSGHRRAFDIFNEHLEVVQNACALRGLRPMIWSDMYFRIGSPSRTYYDVDCVIPEEVAARIPKGVQLVYWDYYHKDAGFYSEWIKRHRALGFEPIVASSVRTCYSNFWYYHQMTKETLDPCLAACRDTGIGEMMLTLWADDGACCEFDSALAGLCYAAQGAFSDSSADEVTAARRFNAACGASYEHAILPSAALNASSAALWDDPLLGILLNELCLQPGGAASLSRIAEDLGELEKKLEPLKNECSAGDMEHAYNLAKAIGQKISLRLELLDAYRGKSRGPLAKAAEKAGTVAKDITTLAGSFRRQWFARNKPQGFEALQNRLASQAERHRETARRITEYLDGKSNDIPELDEFPSIPKGCVRTYGRLASASLIL